MNFIDAVKAMEEGKKVTNSWRKKYAQSYALSEKFDHCSCHIEGYSYGTKVNCAAILVDKDFLADDWEVVEEV